MGESRLGRCGLSCLKFERADAATPAVCTRFLFLCACFALQPPFLVARTFVMGRHHIDYLLSAAHHSSSYVFRPRN